MRHREELAGAADTATEAEAAQGLQVDPRGEVLEHLRARRCRRCGGTTKGVTLGGAGLEAGAEDRRGPKFAAARRSLGEELHGSMQAAPMV